MTDLQLLLIFGAVPAACVLSGAIQITWDGLHQRAKRKRITRGDT